LQTGPIVRGVWGMDKSASKIRIKKNEDLDENSLLIVLYNLENIYFYANMKHTMVSNCLSYFMFVSLLLLFSRVFLVQNKEWPSYIIFALNFSVGAYGLWLLIKGVTAHFKMNAALNLLLETINTIKKKLDEPKSNTNENF
jgi:hypothetical protein